MNPSSTKIGKRLGFACGLLLGASSVLGQQVIFVNADAVGGNDGTSWENAYTDLQAALSEAAETQGPGAVEIQLWVAAATYTPVEPVGDRTATFSLLSAVGLYGGFAGGETELEQRDPDVNVTALSGDLNGDDGEDFANNDENSYNVIVASGTSTTLVDGFTITSGNADGDDAPFYAGGAVFVESGNPTLSNCRIIRNDGGGGVVFNTGIGHLQVTHCVFTDNVVYGIQNGYGNGANLILTVTNSVFEDHVYGGITIGSGTANITGSSFTNNATADNLVVGGGIINNSDNLVVTNCSFTRHGSADEGGAFNNGGENLSLIGCVFYDNDGLAMWTNTQDVTILNSTFIDDRFFMWGGILSIDNSIFWSDDPDDGEEDLIDHHFNGESSLIINNSIVRGWTGQWGGEDNNGEDPLFADADGRLSRGSPAVDTGSNDAVPEDVTTDLDGHVRIADADGFGGAVVDRGAYEVPCPGDANGDGLIDPLDAGFVLARLNCNVGAGDAGCDTADQNGNGVVDPLDVGWILARFGECP